MNVREHQEYQEMAAEAEYQSWVEMAEQEELAKQEFKDYLAAENLKNSTRAISEGLGFSAVSQSTAALQDKIKKYQVAVRIQLKNIRNLFGQINDEMTQKDMFKFLKQFSDQHFILEDIQKELHRLNGEAKLNDVEDQYINSFPNLLTFPDQPATTNLIHQVKQAYLELQNAFSEGLEVGINNDDFTRFCEETKSYKIRLCVFLKQYFAENIAEVLSVLTASSTSSMMQL